MQLQNPTIPGYHTLLQQFGLRHEIFDLTTEKWELDQLLKAGKRLKEPISVHQSYVRQKITNYFGKDCVYWSGFMGDVLAGVDMPKVPNTNKRDAILLLLEPMITKNYMDEAFLNQVVDRIISEFPWDRLAQSNLTLDQQLMTEIRQKQLTGPIVLIPEYEFKTPFLNKHWVNFNISIPYKWLFLQYLYRMIIDTGFKELAKFSTSSSFGMPVRASIHEMYLGKAIAKIKPYITQKDPYRSHPRTNYINWTESLRHKGSFQDTIYITLQDLKKRGIIEIESIDTWWQEHTSGKKDYTTLIMNLSSLELLLQAGVIKP